MTIKKVSVKIYASILTLGLNHHSFLISDEYIPAKDYYKTICPGFLNLRYTGENTFVITYEALNG